MPEWSNGTVSKTVVLVTVPRVRIPVSPLILLFSTMPFTYEYPRPAVTVDVILFSRKLEDIKTLLIQRKNDPFINMWALPGGFVEMDETLEQSALRELYEETGLTRIKITQFQTFGDPDRDPRGRSVSVVFYGFADCDTVYAKAGDDAKNLEWISVNKLPLLAFDHEKILSMAIKELL